MKVLQFSGGLDSLACLLLMRDEPDMCVLTVLTDGAYQSTRDYIERVAARFPTIKFHVLETDRELPVCGYPVDVVPIRWTAMGQVARGGTRIRYQDTFSCCNRAIWKPLDAASRITLKATEIIRGQRNDDRLRSPLNDGDVDRCVRLRFPIATWSRHQVLQYVRAHAPDLMPPGYDEGEVTSRDCWDCTAYLCDNQQRITNLPPDQNTRVNGLLAQWRDDVLTEMEGTS